MKLLTEVDIQPADYKINYAAQGLILGSCFADTIGGYLAALRIKVEANPFGVIYNPLSVLNTLQSIKNSRQYTQNDLVQHNGLWHSIAHHGSFSHPDPNMVLSRINRTYPKNFDYLIITLGTTWLYELGGEVVANCHKIPANQFSRRSMSYEQTVTTLNQIAETYPHAHKIFTVSPIRHIKDGLTQNSLSKAILRATIGEVVNSRLDCSYFPAFEIMIDQLRDYRFYGEDMLHPSNQAAEYIRQKFATTYFDTQTTRFADEISKILRSAQHRPLHPDTETYRNFQVALIDKIKSLAEQYPAADLSDLFPNFV